MTKSKSNQQYAVPMADAHVLSGNMDDKTYNKGTLNELDSILGNLNFNRGNPD